MRTSASKGWTTIVMQGVALLVLLPLCLGACASTPITKMVDSRNPLDLELCTLVSDQELQEIRGCYNGYNTYYFALDVGIDLTTFYPGITVTYDAVVPGDMAPSFEGNRVHFNDGNVAFDAGLGNSSLGVGVYSVVNVAGNNNIVIANTNVNINIPNASQLIPTLSPLQTPLILSGIR